MISYVLYKREALARLKASLCTMFNCWKSRRYLFSKQGKRKQGVVGSYLYMFGYAQISQCATLAMVSTKKASAKAEAENRRAARAQCELEAFGEAQTPWDGGLVEYETWWSQHYEWLREQGYLLRPRYAPDWVPSWQGKDMDTFMYEDARVSEVGKLQRQQSNPSQLWSKASQYT